MQIEVIVSTYRINEITQDDAGRFIHVEAYGILEECESAEEMEEKFISEINTSLTEMKIVENAALGTCRFIDSRYSNSASVN